MENFIIINGNEISDLNKPVFKIEENKELDIKDMLEDNQQLFIDYMSTGNIGISLCNDIDDMSVLRSERNKYNNFIKNFINPINRIEVMKNKSDDKYVSINNKVFLYIAKKYDLNIIVYLV